jgi:hypothetical protein
VLCTNNDDLCCCCRPSFEEVANSLEEVEVDIEEWLRAREAAARIDAIRAARKKVFAGSAP